MTTTYLEARDEIYSQFYEVLKAEAPAVCGYVPDVQWWNTTEVMPPAGDKIWVRVYRQTIHEFQSTLCEEVEGPGKKRYDAYGAVYVLFWVPKFISNADTILGQLCVLARKAYRSQSTSGCIWFRNVRIGENLEENEYLRGDVTAEYRYDEIG